MSTELPPLPTTTDRGGIPSGGAQTLSDFDLSFTNRLNKSGVCMLCDRFGCTEKHSEITAEAGMDGILIRCVCVICGMPGHHQNKCRSKNDKKKARRTLVEREQWRQSLPPLPAQSTPPPVQSQAGVSSFSRAIGSQNSGSTVAPPPSNGVSLPQVIPVSSTPPAVHPAVHPSWSQPPSSFFSATTADPEPAANGSPSPWPPVLSGGVSQNESMVVPPRSTGGIPDGGHLATVGPDGSITINGQRFSLTAL